MFSLIYRSWARDSFDLPGIYQMLSQAREFNANHQITGCLLYHRGRFIQMLEGEEKDVLGLYERIEGDERHSKVELLEEEPIEQRVFSEWSMAFQDIGAPEQHSKYKEMLLHSYFDRSRLFNKPSKTGLALFTGIHHILSAS